MNMYEKYSSVKEDSMFDMIKKHESITSKEEFNKGGSSDKTTKHSARKAGKFYSK